MSLGYFFCIIFLVTFSIVFSSIGWFFTKNKISSYEIKKYLREKKFYIIRKNKVGVPRLFFKDKEQKTSFTISHHGNYGGYAILNYWGERDQKKIIYCMC